MLKREGVGKRKVWDFSPILERNRDEYMEMTLPKTQGVFPFWVIWIPSHLAKSSSKSMGLCRNIQIPEFPYMQFVQVYAVQFHANQYSLTSMTDTTRKIARLMKYLVLMSLLTTHASRGFPFLGHMDSCLAKSPSKLMGLFHKRVMAVRSQRFSIRIFCNFMPTSTVDQHDPCSHATRKIAGLVKRLELGSFLTTHASSAWILKNQTILLYQSWHLNIHSQEYCLIYTSMVKV